MKNIKLTAVIPKQDQVDTVNAIFKLQKAIESAKALNYPDYLGKLRLDLQNSRNDLKTIAPKRYTLQAKVAGQFQKLEGIKTIKKVKEHLEAFKLQEKEVRKKNKTLAITQRSRSIGKQGATLSYTKGVRQESGYILSLRNRINAAKCYNKKTPLTNDNYVGIELEFCSPFPMKDLALALAKAGLQDYLELKRDPSIRAVKGDYTVEMAILVKESDVASIVPRITAVLKETKCYVNETCGMHVHLDMRNRDVQSSYKKLFQASKFLIETQPPTRREGQYCKANKFPTYIEELKSANESGRKYWTINPQAYSKYRTLEIRSHSGTVNETKILTWVKMLTGLINSDIVGEKPFTSLKTLAYRANLNEDEVEYFWDRMERFKVFYNDNENTEVNLVTIEGETRLIISPLLTIEEKNVADSKAATSVNTDSRTGDSNVF